MVDEWWMNGGLTVDEWWRKCGLNMDGILWYYHANKKGSNRAPKTGAFFNVEI